MIFVVSLPKTKDMVRQYSTSLLPLIRLEYGEPSHAAELPVKMIMGVPFQKDRQHRQVWLGALHGRRCRLQAGRWALKKTRRSDGDPQVAEA